jgi:hypothetical protein
MGDSYAERWRRKERDLGFEDTGVEMVVCGEWTLPSDAAPMLTFGEASRPRPIWEVYGIPSRWSAEERERLGPYQMIGSDSAGNPICVESVSGAAWLLDHEDQFRTSQFVNTGVPQLAECLLAYLGERDPERFRSAVLAIDPPALAERSFWWHEAAGVGAYT